MPNTDDVKGRAKEAAGDLTGDDDLKNEARPSAKGKVEDAVDKVADKLTGKSLLFPAVPGLRSTQTGTTDTGTTDRSPRLSGFPD